jgi:DNA gyrase subunit A
VDELQEIRDKYGDKRRTEIVEAEGDLSIEDLVPDEDVVCTVTHRGYIKRVPLSEYRAQGRGGKGLRAMDTRDEDFVKWVHVVNAHANMLFLSSDGKAFTRRVFEIPQMARTARGRPMVNFVGFEEGEAVAAMVPIRAFVDDGFLLTVTVGGKVKRTALSAYESIRQTGIIGVGIDEGDSLLAARVVTEGQEVLIGTAGGMSIRFSVDDVRPTGS